MSPINNAITQNATSQAEINGQVALDLLMDGNKRFLDKQTLTRNHHQQVNETGGGQWPFAIVLSCIDSRVPTEIVFDQGVGDIFNAKVAGNFVNADILGSMEYAVKFAGSKLILVMGHTSCGAVKGACDDLKAGNLTHLLSNIRPAVEQTSSPNGEAETSANIEYVNNVAVQNVKNTLENIINDSEIIAELVNNGSIKLAGAMYDVKTGKVSMI